LEDTRVIILVGVEHYFTLKYKEDVYRLKPESTSFEMTSNMILSSPTSLFCLVDINAVKISTFESVECVPRFLRRQSLIHKSFAQ
jgi:hypothetical protein